MGTTTMLSWPLVGRTADLERIVAALSDDAVRVVHLVGDAGTGKSRLAEECLRGAELDGYPVAHVAASDAAAVVPLSALSPLLPAGTSPSLDPGGVLDSVVAHVRELGDGARVVVHVDDVDRLDVVSADLLARLWREGLVVVVATQRSGTATPGVLLAEQRRGACRASTSATSPAPRSRRCCTMCSAARSPPAPSTPCGTSRAATRSTSASS